MLRAIIIAFLLLVSSLAFADSLLTSEPVTLFDGPSKKAQPRFILSGGHPLKEISRLHGWRKVVIFSGEIGWLPEDKTRIKRAAVVKVANAVVRFDPSEDSPPAFIATSNLVLEVLPKSRRGWYHVLHINGETGYIAANEVWLNF